jgi:hypothetical protein
VVGLTLVLAAAWTARPAHAVLGFDTLDSPTGFAFLEVPGGSRASALGGAFTTLAEGVDAAFWNPAGLSFVTGMQVSGTHYEFFENLRHDHFALAGRLGGGGLSASMRALYSEPIEERDDFGNLVGTFGAHDLEFALGYGAEVGGGVRAGLSAAWVRERIGNLATSSYSLGGGATWDPAQWPGLRLGLSAHNLGPDAHYRFDGIEGAAVPLPYALQGGASYRWDVGSTLGVRAALETRMTRGRSAIGMLGAELSQTMGAAVRMGMRANDDASSFSLGAGYGFQALRIDYAFVPYRLDLGDTHRLSFAAQF